MCHLLPEACFPKGSATHRCPSSPTGCPHFRNLPTTLASCCARDLMRTRSFGVADPTRPIRDSMFAQWLANDPHLALRHQTRQAHISRSATTGRQTQSRWCPQGQSRPEPKRQHRSCVQRFRARHLNFWLTAQGEHALRVGRKQFVMDAPCSGTSGKGMTKHHGRRWTPGACATRCPLRGPRQEPAEGQSPCLANFAPPRSIRAPPNQSACPLVVGKLDDAVHGKNRQSCTHVHP